MIAIITIFHLIFPFYISVHDQITSKGADKNISEKLNLMFSGKCAKKYQIGNEKKKYWKPQKEYFVNRSLIK